MQAESATIDMNNVILISDITIYRFTRSRPNFPPKSIAICVEAAAPLEAYPAIPEGITNYFHYANDTPTLSASMFFFKMYLWRKNPRGQKIQHARRV